MSYFVLTSTERERTANISQPVQTFWLPDYSTLLCFLQILFTWARSRDGTLESLYSDFLLLSVKTTETSSTFPCSQQLIRDWRLSMYWLTDFFFFANLPPSLKTTCKIRGQNRSEENSSKVMFSGFSVR